MNVIGKIRRSPTAKRGNSTRGDALHKAVGRAMFWRAVRQLVYFAVGYAPREQMILQTLVTIDRYTTLPSSDC